VQIKQKLKRRPVLKTAKKHVVVRIRKQNKFSLSNKLKTPSEKDGVFLLYL
jgi:hypothetical protein